ncbi:MAG: hypothetical protein U0324_18760 [Polyangiales bacterium]
MDGELPKSIDALIVALVTEGVEFVVIGGVAGVLHGASIVTRDLDIVHRRTPENIARLLRVLHSIDAVKRADPRRLRPDETWLSGRGHILLDSSAGPVDVLCELDHGQDYDWLLERSEVIPMGEAPVRVVDLPTLIELKTKAGRPKDRLTVPILVATLEERIRAKG